MRKTVVQNFSQYMWRNGRNGTFLSSLMKWWMGRGHQWMKSLDERLTGTLTMQVWGCHYLNFTGQPWHPDTAGAAVCEAMWSSLQSLQGFLTKESNLNLGKALGPTFTYTKYEGQRNKLMMPQGLSERGTVYRTADLVSATSHWLEKNGRLGRGWMALDSDKWHMTPVCILIRRDLIKWHLWEKQRDGIMVTDIRWYWGIEHSVNLVTMWLHKQYVRVKWHDTWLL